MARLPAPYVCDYCGVQKRESNHWWFSYKISASFPQFSLRAWDDERASQGDVEHICGQECAQKALAKYMASVDSANAGKPQPANESQEERQNKN
jgi:hypothetical protein